MAGPSARPADRGSVLQIDVTAGYTRADRLRDLGRALGAAAGDGQLAAQRVGGAGER